MIPDRLLHFAHQGGGRTYPFRDQSVTIPTLQAVFDRFPDLLINIDLKEPLPGKEARLWATIQQARLGLPPQP